MPRGRKFDPIIYFMEKAGAHAMLLKNNPQCEDCEHMEFMAFNYDYHVKVTRKEYCPQCPKYEKKDG